MTDGLAQVITPPLEAVRPGMGSGLTVYVTDATGPVVAPLAQTAVTVNVPVVFVFRVKDDGPAGQLTSTLSELP